MTNTQLIQSMLNMLVLMSADLKEMSKDIKNLKAVSEPNTLWEDYKELMARLDKPKDIIKSTTEIR